MCCLLKIMCVGNSIRLVKVILGSSRFSSVRVVSWFGWMDVCMLVWLLRLVWLKFVKVLFFMGSLLLW